MWKTKHIKRYAHQVLPDGCHALDENIDDITNPLVTQNFRVTKDEVFRVDEFETAAETTHLIFRRSSNIEGDRDKR